jgi:hypothetical protein
MMLAHPRAEGCGPFAVRFRARCGPFAVSKPTNSRELERTRSRQTQRLRRFSRVFAAVRASLRISGRMVQVGFPVRFSGRLRSQLRSSYRARTGSLAGGGPPYAIVNDRMANYPHQAPQGRGSLILESA